ncbi:hypothetical protein X777_10080 [Ooceraea biroi]|uniref:Uncharacterized protein n=1 Tax=Ooceraea biroi TaxID=2015173 RepID=A0A026X2A4_OOCBI|nr:hypothetical protein X777_10080 [Ooceraea biroi]
MCNLTPHSFSLDDYRGIKSITVTPSKDWFAVTMWIRPYTHANVTSGRARKGKRTVRGLSLMAFFHLDVGVVAQYEET